jgi:hypothetical protein
MSALHEVTKPATALKRIRALSRPITILLTIALGLILVIQVPLIFAILFLFHGAGSWHASISFSELGVGVAIFDDVSSVPARSVMLETLTFTQRAALSALAASGAAFTALTLHHLRRLFALYSRGAVFARENAHHLKRFALWLVVTAIALNISGRLYAWVTGTYPSGLSNAALALVLGGMIYVVARVMELAAEADEERREFV